MKNTTVLKMPYEAYKKNTILRLAVCIAAAVAVLAVNIVLYRHVTKKTAALFALINTVLDVACCWGILYYTLNVLLVRKRLLKLYKASVDRPLCMEGTVMELSSPQKVYRLDCLTAALDTNEGLRKVFVITGSFEDLLAPGTKVRLKLSSNVAVSVEVEDED